MIGRNLTRSPLRWIVGLVLATALHAPAAAHSVLAASLLANLRPALHQYSMAAAQLSRSENIVFAAKAAWPDRCRCRN